MESTDTIDITDKDTSPAPDLKTEPLPTKLFFLTLLLMLITVMAWLASSGMDPTSQSPYPIHNPPVASPAPDS